MSLNSQQNSLLDKLARLQARVEDHVEDTGDEYQRIYRQLWTDPTTRDAELWELVLSMVVPADEAQALAGVTLEQIADTPIRERSPEVVAAMETAARLQALSTQAHSVIRLSEQAYPAAHESSVILGKRAAAEAGTVGVSREMVNERRRKNQKN